MTPRESAQKEAEKTYAAFLKISKRVTIYICVILFVVVVIFDSGVG
jgi:hypothetical protein